jgi:hypothetical protein
MTKKHARCTKSLIVNERMDVPRIRPLGIRSSFYYNMNKGRRGVYLGYWWTHGA